MPARSISHKPSPMKTCPTNRRLPSRVKATEFTPGRPEARSLISPSTVLMRTTPSRNAVQTISPLGLKARSSASPAGGPTIVSIVPVVTSRAKMLSPPTLAAKSRPSGPNATPLIVWKPDASTICSIAKPGSMTIDDILPVAPLGEVITAGWIKVPSFIWNPFLCFCFDSSIR